MRSSLLNKNRVFLEGDYGGLEVRGIAMASKDQELSRQIIEGVDTHEKWASLIYDIPLDKFRIHPDYGDMRYNGKNGFVFPSFYGSEPPAIAKYEAFLKYGIPIKRVEEIQREFWKEFCGVRAWQREIIDFYNKNGYIQTMSGFVCPGPLSLYQLFNFPIQGPCFHLLLMSLKEIDEEIEKRGLKSEILFEVHDSATFSAVPSEVPEIMELSTEIMSRKRFEWQRDIPLLIEWEIGSNYHNLGLGLDKFGVEGGEENIFTVYKTNKREERFDLYKADEASAKKEACELSRSFGVELIGC